MCVAYLLLQTNLQFRLHSMITNSSINNRLKGDFVQQEVIIILQQLTINETTAVVTTFYFLRGGFCLLA